MSTAGIIIIGNEILSGKVADVNSAFLCEELYKLGVEVMRISTIPDDIEQIAEEVRKMSRAYDYVFTSGGVGPTHDDCTLEGVAQALGRGLTVRREITALLERYLGGPLNEGQLKMARVPEGSELLGNASIVFPVTAVENVYLFPGIPKLLRLGFEDIRERFRGSVPFALRRLYLNCYESEVAEELRRVQDAFPDVRIGSYPRTGEEAHRVLLTFESRDSERVALAFDALRQSLPVRFVIGSEPLGEVS